MMKGENIIKLLVFSLVILLEGCKQQDMDDYVYIDLMDVLHTKQDCKAVAREHNAQPVEPVPLSKVTSGMLDRICSRCVGREEYTALQALADDAQGKNEDNTSESQDSIATDSVDEYYSPGGDQ